ncbi:hypothetical protein GCM10007913_06010 [Devosia yakushimensis]|uniref:Uncharacterized protein n=2 Tax=Devosia yakushimensis TaxID=470028 RepID=A0ABQ5U9W5_9HYPH|nr:hypothetical protein GCM10007913_06010 [Devosia yakushimensis]
MHKSTSPKRKSFRLFAIASAALLAVGSAGALIAGVTPATAASLANHADTQIAVFMVPLTILLVAILYEAARIALRGNLPVEAPARRAAGRYWSPDRGEG